MSVSYSTPQPQRQTRKGLAITSLVIGIISVPTLGLLVVGAMAGIALGAIALNRIKKEPMIYGGKGMAIAGIITSGAVAHRDFIVCEDGIIHFVESKTPGVVKRGEGSTLDSSFHSR